MKKRVLLSALLSVSLILFGSDASAAGTSEENSSHFLTTESVNQIFGTLPQYLDLGSFLINRLNNVPFTSVKDTYLFTKDSEGNYFKTRPSFKVLQKHIEKTISASQGDWGIYIKDLSNNTVISINEHPMESASLIKLYIAGATLEKIENGTLVETDTINRALHEMITVSDNESSNVLVRSFYSSEEGQTFQDGLDMVNDFIDRYGFSSTAQVNGIADPSLWVSDGRVNETSPADCGKFLELIYNRELVSHYSSYRLENLLNNQEVNYKIPRSLPEGTPIAHKTGEVDDTENDAAIVYTSNGDYIICIMSTNLTSTSSAVDTIRNISRYVYDWFAAPVTIMDEEAYHALQTSISQ